MHRLLHIQGGGRNHPQPGLNKPLPEPLVDPDEGKTPIGEVVIVPIQGRDLPNRERFGKQDPFILFKLGNQSKRTSTDIRGGQRPRWKDDQAAAGRLLCRIASPPPKSETGEQSPMFSFFFLPSVSMLFLQSRRLFPFRQNSWSLSPSSFPSPCCLVHR
ncbi:hypothetical protein B0O80DRAFT_142195 [Mortierella sp. GBAus27b]|nr:hypothetical protein B0O80DRAFT_142195 [Mortierella sp. GBAus27b]